MWASMYKNILVYLLIGALVGILVGSMVGDVMLGVLIGLALGVAAYVMRQRGGSFSGGRGGHASGGRGAYKTLLAKARGDKALVERLIAYEQKRNPSGTRNEWVTDALDRWERDRT